jgi:hypothetical protein
MASDALIDAATIAEAPEAAWTFIPLGAIKISENLDSELPQRLGPK